VLVAAWCRRVPNLRLLLPISLALHVAAAGVMYGYHDLARLAGIELTRKIDPFSRLRGWNHLGQAVQAQFAEHPGFVLLTAFAVPQLVVIAVVALLSRAHANWAATAYVTATLLVVAWIRMAPTLRPVLTVSLGLHIAAAVAMYGYHDAAKLAGIELTRSTDPFHRLRGWNYLGNAVAAQLKENPGAALMTDDRMLFAELAFYVRPRPTQVAWSWKERPTDQYQMTTDLASVGNRTILYLTENPDPRDVRERFVTMVQVSRITIPLYRDLQRHYTVYALQGFKG
ncbi:MAG: hypothetical protein JO021_12885, partial [Alphaproteobacteria bacterium]|nr:hypothetical protein [Alphaproteobacteria bacterium]